MWGEVRWRFDFGAEEVLWLVGVLFTAVVAADLQGLTYDRRRQDGVGFGEGDLVAEEKILARVVAAVLAEHNQKILCAVKQAVLLRATAWEKLFSIMRRAVCAHCQRVLKRWQAVVKRRRVTSGNMHGGGVSSRDAARQTRFQGLRRSMQRALRKR